MIWNLWWMGIKAEKIQPYRYLKSFDLSTRTMQSYFTKAKFVIELIAFRSDHPSVETRRAFEQGNSDINFFDVSFDTGFMYICNNILYPGLTDTELQMRRVGDMSYVSVYDIIKRRKRQRESS